MLDVLDNPMTEQYVGLKQHVLSSDFPLHWIHATICADEWCQANALGERCPNQNDEDIPFLSHAVLRRTGDKSGTPEVGSPIFHQARQVFDEILDHNGIGPRHFYRMNVNMTMPTPKRMSPTHTDHPYPHSNLLVYLNGFTGGRTWVEGVEGPQPIEDMVVTFGGVPHRAAPPIEDRRVVLVATYGTDDEDTTSWVEITE